jgi:CelD/BcsL family acetyltransferase involved in cellulose biosynthesis
VTTPATGVLLLPELGRWAPQWDRLVDLSPLPSPFLRSWWLAGTSGPASRFMLAVQDDRLLGGLALEERRLLGIPRLRMASAGLLCPEHLDLLAGPGQEDAVVRVTGDWLRRPGARVLDLEGIHAGSSLSTVLPGTARREPLAAAPWVPLPPDARAYLDARPRGFRKTLRQASSRLSAEGSAHRINRRQSAARSLGVLRQLHSAQWGDRSRFLPGFDRFAAACRLGAEFDEVAVHELTVGETVIAVMVTFEVAGRVSLYQSARLTDFRWRDATSVLLAAIITDACERGFTEVDFLRGEEAYKRNFASERRDLFRLRAASGGAAQVFLAADTAARRTRRVAASSARSARSARASWRGLPGARPGTGRAVGRPLAATSRLRHSRSTGAGSRMRRHVRVHGQGAPQGQHAGTALQPGDDRHDPH